MDASGIADAPEEVKDTSSGCSDSRGDIADDTNLQANEETQKDKDPAVQVIDANANEHKGKGTSTNGEARNNITNDDAEDVSLTQASELTDLDSSYPSESCSVPSGAAIISSATSKEDDSSIVKKDGVRRPINEEKKLEKPLNEILNDAGQFSYVALCSVNLGLLFEDEWNRIWKEKTVQNLVKHMKLPKKTIETMLMFMSTVQDREGAVIFAKALLDDPCLLRPQLIAQDLIGHSLASGQYDARSRVLALHVASLMGMEEADVQDFEATIVSSFVQGDVELSEEEQKEKEKRAKLKKVKRFAMIGAAAVGGGALIGLTGGLAAPLIASAGVALLGGSVGFLGTAAGVAVLASVFGAAGAGLTGFKMKKRVGAVEEFSFEAVSHEKDLHVTIAVSGWLTKDTLTYEDELYNNFSVPWLTLASSKEVYCLRWESKYLLALGEALSLIINKVLTMAAKEALKMTVLAGLVVAFALPATAYTSLVAIDNPWSVVTNRAAEAGKQLAEVLLSRQQGKRPVTLIGFSMGARVIFFCLKELANRKGCEGIVQDAVLLGAPVPSTVKYWKPFARVVAGRVINGYCRGDWLLQYIYRAASVQMNDIAGLGPIAWEDRRMVNMDLTDIVNGHFDYSEKMDEILKYIGIRTCDSPISQTLAKLTRTTADDRHPTTGTVTLDDGEKDFAVIDASDLILTTNNPTAAQAMSIPSAAGPEATQTGPNRFQPVIHEDIARLQECSIGSERASSEEVDDCEVGEEPQS